jgi:hypothetical protein
MQTARMVVFWIFLLKHFSQIQKIFIAFLCIRLDLVTRRIVLTG